MQIPVVAMGINYMGVANVEVYAIINLRHLISSCKSIIYNVFPQNSFKRVFIGQAVNVHRHQEVANTLLLLQFQFQT